MFEDIDLEGALEKAIAAAGGVVIVDGRPMIKTDVVRSVTRSFVAELFSVARDRLPGSVSDDPAAQKKLAALLGESERRLEKLITDKLPFVQ
jgi:hypothetical protein